MKKFKNLFIKDKITFVQFIVIKKGEVLDISAYGVNSHVKFKNVKLGDEFKDIIVNIGKPDSYLFKDKYVTLNYKNSHFTVVKLQKGYQIVEIDVDFTNASDATR